MRQEGGGERERTTHKKTKQNQKTKKKRLSLCHLKSNSIDSIYSSLLERHPQLKCKKLTNSLLFFSRFLLTAEADGDSAHAQIELLAFYFSKTVGCAFSSFLRWICFGGNHITNRFHFPTLDSFGMLCEWKPRTLFVCVCGLFFNAFLWQRTFQCGCYLVHGSLLMAYGTSSSCLHLGSFEVLRSLRLYLLAQSQGPSTSCRREA